MQTTSGPALHTLGNACQHNKYKQRPDDENPLVFYGNWETPGGKRFFCEWYVDCPPCEDSIRGPCPPGGGDWDGQDADGLGHPDVDDFDFNY